MKYTITDLSQNDLIIIGNALDAEPHGKVFRLVARIQAQITAQDKIPQSNSENTQVEG